jgi:1-deoxy-D-xylulose-5-phosphate reductoisomerase
LKKRIAILGSTGSIGKQALEVIGNFPDRFEVEVLTANKNATLLAEQALKFNPNVVVIADELKYDEVSEKLCDTDVKVYAGTEAVEQITAMETIDMVLVAITGFSGLKPTLAALENKKPVALANKESLVIAGELITEISLQNRVPIIPVDSEHSAVFQSLAGEGNNPVEKVILTASGGPFRGFSNEELKKITPEEALKHPNWKMGDKISIDSATLLNKGLEAMEARWLFGLDPDQIEVVVHPQSIVHALVYFTDGNVKSVMSLPDMKIPIQYALSYPDRLKTKAPRLDLIRQGPLTFETVDTKIFRNLALAFKAMEKGGNTPCILNAANEIAVDAFLNKRLDFIEIPNVIEECVSKINFIQKPSLNDYMKTDEEVRVLANKIIENKIK